MFGLGAGLAYLLLCPNLSLSDIQLPSRSGGSSGPQYREIGSAEGFNYDSGDDEEPDDFSDDPTGRKRMTELASFSSRSEANNTNADSAAASNPQQSGFPRTNFSMSSAAATQSNARSAPAPSAEDDLQNELELFAQGDDEAEGALIDMNELDQP